MADNVIDITFKPTIDNKEIQKEMKHIAETSKTAIEQTYRSLELTMRKSVESMGKDFGRNISMDAFVGNFVDKVKELNQYIRETGNLPVNMTSKLYVAEQAVMDLIDKYHKLDEAARRFNDDAKRVETKEYTKLNQDIELAKGKYDAVVGTIKRLNQEFIDLKAREELVSQVKGGEKTLEDYKRRIEKIKEYEEEIRKLKALQSADMTTGRGRGLVGEELERNRQQIAELEKKIKGANIALNKFGSEGKIKLQQILDIESRISDEFLKSGDTSAILQQIKEEEARVDDLKLKYDELIAKRNAMPAEQRYSMSAEWSNLTREIAKTEREIVVAASRVNEMEGAIKKSSFSMSKLRNVAWAFSRVLGNIYTLGLDVVRGTKMIVNWYKRIWSAAKKVLSVLKSWKDNIKGTADEHKKSWKQMLRDILRYSLGIRSLFALFRKLRGYIKEAFEAMAEQIPEVNQMLSSLKSSLGMLKGSLATAFEPILSAIAPALERLIDLLAKVITYIGMFWAALTGRGYVYKATKAMQNIAGAAKEMNKQLQGFDELNNLTSDKDSGSGSGPLANFEKVDVPDWIKNLVDKIKEIARQLFEPIKKAWDLVGKYVIESWKHALNSVKDLFSDIGRDFLKAWTEDGTQIFINIFNIVGDIGNAIGYIADALRKAWDYNNNGYKIWKAILGIVERISYWVREITLDFANWTKDLNLTPAMIAFREWLESLVPVADAAGSILYDIWHDTIKPMLDWTFNGENSGIQRLLDIFTRFNKKVNWSMLRANLDKVWRALGRFSETIGEGLLEFLNRMAERLADWINSKDFEDTCDRIVKFLDEIKPEDIADDLEQVWNILKNIADELWKIIKYVIDHKDTILNTLEWISEHLELIAGIAIFGKLAIDISRFTINLFLLKTVLTELIGIEGFTGLAAAMLGCEPTALSIAGALGSVAFEFVGILATIGTLIVLWKTFFDPDVLASFRDVFTDTANLIKDFFTGNWANLVEDWGKIQTDFESLTYNIKKSFYENIVLPIAEAFGMEIPESFAEFNQCLESTDGQLRYVYEDIESGALPAFKDMEEAVKNNVTGYENQQKALEGLKNKLFEVNPELDDLSRAMQDNNVKGYDNIDTLEQIYIGLEKFKQNGGDAKDTTAYLKEEFGYADKSAKDFFKRLEKGKDDVVNVTKTMSGLGDEFKKYGETTVKSYDEAITSTSNRESKSVISIWADNIKKWFHDSALKFGSPSQTMITFGKDTVLGFNQGINNTKASTTSVINSYINGIVNAFIGMRNSLVNVFNNLASSIGSILSSIASGVSSVMNNIANAIDNMRSNINNITSGISSRFNVSIPRLASGAVIPPNNEFLAVLGDQKSGTNIETPLSTMIEAFNVANKGGSEQELALLQEQNDLLRQLLNKEFGISEHDIFRSVRNQNKIYTKSTGRSAFA